jgi:oligopeptide transport system substrate-binding protein
VCARDDLTLDVELEAPVSQFLYMLTAAGAFPVPRHVVAAHGAAWTEAGRIVSNGPFCLERWNGDEGMTLRRNSRYAGHRVGNVERVVLRFPQDPSTLDLTAPLAEFRSGKLDILTLTDAVVSEGDRIRRQYADSYVTAPWLFTVYLGFVTSRPPCDDVRLRRALAMAIDREALAHRALRGMCAPGTGGFVPPGMSGHTPGLALPHDPVVARQLLADAGFPKGEGVPVLEMLSVPPIDALVLDSLEAQWRETLGVQVTWDVADWSTFQERLVKDPPYAYLLARFPDWPDPAYFVHTGEQEYTRWTYQVYDQLLAEARYVQDHVARLDLLCQADQILMQEAPIVPLLYGRQHLLVQPWVIRYPISPLNRWYWKDTVIEPH